MSENFYSTQIFGNSYVVKKKKITFEIDLDVIAIQDASFDEIRHG